MLRTLPVLFAAALSLAACTTTNIRAPKLPSSADPAQEITRLDREIDNARAENLAVMSPEWYSAAQASLAEARTRREQGRAQDAVLESVARGRAQLDRAFATAEVATDVLAPAIRAREAARKAGATKYGRDYEDAEARFLQLTRAVESGDTAWAKKRQDATVDAFGDLELRAIKEGVLSDVRNIVAKARAEGAVEHAPRTLARTEGEFAALERFIAEQRYARKEINARAGALRHAALRLLHVTRRSRAVTASGPEQTALEEVAMLDKLTAALGIAGPDERSLDKQRESIEIAVAELKGDRDFVVTQNRALRAEVAQLRVNLAALEGTSAIERERLEALEAEKRLVKLYDEVSGYFDANEAQVYKQNDRLILRLRGLTFPVGSDEPSPESYPLLAKVQKSIRAFGEPRVVIEGHTDDTGPAALNDHLSQKRAEAVRFFLTTNNVLPEDLVTAVGKGFSEPIATNKTADGRALNRRIDVIIEPRAAEDAS